MRAEFVKEGRAFGDQTPRLAVEPGEENDVTAEYQPYRELAFAVFRQALIDLGVRMDKMRGQGGQVVRGPGRGLEPDDHEQRSARLFLFDPDWADMRGHWLAWLGLDEGDFRAMLERPSYQGGENRVLAMLAR